MRLSSNLGSSGYLALIVVAFGGSCGGKSENDKSMATSGATGRGAGTAGNQTTLASNAGSYVGSGGIKAGGTGGTGGTARSSTTGTGGSSTTATVALGGNPSIPCGNGKVDPNEECDDGNRLDFDGCSSNCRLDDPIDCMPPVPVFACGNSKREPGEGCDDGNRNGDDGCTDGCRVEVGYNCPVPGKACLPITDQTPRCGNGIIDETLGETCDDGLNDGTYDGCTPDCQRASFCGDGVKNGSEQCDYGSQNAPVDKAVYASCMANCQLGPHCGDGVVQSPMEMCDLGICNGKLSWDPCQMDCQISIGP